MSWDKQESPSNGKPEFRWPTRATSFWTEEVPCGCSGLHCLRARADHRQERANASRPFIYAQYDPKLRAFLDFVLAQYVSEGVGELDQAKFVDVGADTFVRAEAVALKRDAVGVIVRHFPDAPAIYAARGWQLPASIARVYDASRAERVLGFRCTTDLQCVCIRFARAARFHSRMTPG